MPQGISAPSTSLVLRLHEFLTNLHEQCGLAALFSVQRLRSGHDHSKTISEAGRCRGRGAVGLCPLADRTSRRAFERCAFGTESDDRSRGDSYAIC